MGKKNDHGPRGDICCLCFKTTGFSEKEVRRLPNGELAQYDCINDNFHKKVIQPAKGIIPDLPRIGLIGQPEHVINTFLKSVADYPMETVGEIIKSVDQFAQNMLGKKIAPGGFIAIY